jgi:hypothetical protein
MVSLFRFPYLYFIFPNYIYLSLFPFIFALFHIIYTLFFPFLPLPPFSYIIFLILFILFSFLLSPFPSIRSSRLRLTPLSP